MALRLFDTLSSQIKPFSTVVAGKANVYVCGPTVYDFSHIGHARCYVIYDVLVRHLRASGYEVNYVRNVTDVNDAIIKRADERGVKPEDLAIEFYDYFSEDMKALGNIAPDDEPRVSDSIEAIIALVQTLIEKGHAYESAGDVYFSVESYPAYGGLSHRSQEQMLAGASGRVEQSEQERKKHSADFALWKSAGTDEMGWQSPWGFGRPGWHIECSAMSFEKLGKQLDLHGGGLDLVFPHHENEIAQSECAHGCTYSGHWMHNGFVQVNKEKMSKSLGNFFVARELFEKCAPEAVRYAMLTVHYRSPFALNWVVDHEHGANRFAVFEDAEKRLEYLYATKERIGQISPKRIAVKGVEAGPEITEFKQRLAAALDEDLSFPSAIAASSEMLKAINELCDLTVKKQTIAESAVESSLQAFVELERYLGIGGAEPAEFRRIVRDRRATLLKIDPNWVSDQIVARRQARQDKDFALADRIRDVLVERGIELFDTAEGTDYRIQLPPIPAE